MLHHLMDHCPVAVRHLFGNHYVLEHGEIGEYLGELERPHHPELDYLMRVETGHVYPFEKHLSAVWALESGHDIEQRRFPGAVWAYHSLYRSLLHPKADSIKSLDAAVLPGQVFYLEYHR